MDRSQLQAVVRMPMFPACAPEDVGSPEAAVLALYDSISGPPEVERERDWDRLRSLFAPRAAFRLVRWINPDGADEVLREWSVDEFIEAGKAVWQDVGFWEQEVWRCVERYGNIAHVLSTYESRVSTPDTAPVSRGVNSFQLVRTDGRWWIVSTVWDVEEASNPIPAEMLP